MEENAIDITDMNQPPTIRVSGFASQSSNTSNNTENKFESNKNDIAEPDITIDEGNQVQGWIKQDNGSVNNSPIVITNFKSLSSPVTPSSNNSLLTSPTSSSQKSVRRRIRRKNQSPDDQALTLTEMSVRGLNLFRYASIQDGLYQCTECLKENVQKTFKNKYSFQRHAFLYHEGTQRKGEN